MFDPIWMMWKKKKGGMMFLPVMTAMSDTLYNHCFLRLVLIKMTLKLSQSLVAKQKTNLQQSETG